MPIVPVVFIPFRRSPPHHQASPTSSHTLYSTETFDHGISSTEEIFPRQASLVSNQETSSKDMSTRNNNNGRGNSPSTTDQLTVKSARQANKPISFKSALRILAAKVDVSSSTLKTFLSTFEHDTAPLRGAPADVLAKLWSARVHGHYESSGTNTHLDDISEDWDDQGRSIIAAIRVAATAQSTTNTDEYDLEKESAALLVQKLRFAELVVAGLFEKVAMNHVSCKLLITELEGVKALISGLGDGPGGGAKMGSMDENAGGDGGVQDPDVQGF